MRKWLLFAFASIWGLIFASSAFAQNDMPQDYLQCVENEQRVICTLHIYNYIQKTKKILTNGWENTVQIDIILMNADQTQSLQRSRLEATQRCYIDPFDSPCLILWRGAKSWQRYKNEEKFLKAISKIGIHALTLRELPPDNYIVKIFVQIAPSAQKRVQSIRNWFKHNTESKGISIGNGTLIGALISSKAEQTEQNGDNAQVLEISTTPFYIDITHDDAQDGDENEDENPEDNSDD